MNKPNTNPPVITDAMLDSLEAQGKALHAIAEALRQLPEDRRLAVFRAASILSIGADPLCSAQWNKP